MDADALIADCLEDILSPEDRALLEDRLLTDPELAACILEQQRLHEALKALCGPASASLETAILASLPGSRQEKPAARTLSTLARVSPPRRDLRFTRRIATIAATGALIAGSGWIIGSRPSAPLATVRTEAGARWSSARTPVAGRLAKGEWRLEAGVVDLGLDRGVTATVQGPATFDLSDPARLNLRSGRISVSVPAAAHGFTVGTPAGDVIDLGTRFGIDVEASGKTGAQVLDGRVRVSLPPAFRLPRQELVRGQALTLDPESRSMEPAPFDPARFPVSAAVVSDLLRDGGWEPGTRLGSRGLPVRSGRWSGDRAAISRGWGDVRPHEGRGMLRFLGNSSDPKRPPEPVHLNSSEQWQFIDLSPLSAEIARGGVTAEAEIRVNQSGGAPARFTLTLQALPESPHSPFVRQRLLAGDPELALARKRSGRTVDSDPLTWQPIRVRLPLPPATRSLLVGPRAGLPRTGHEDRGYFADACSLRLLLPPQPGR